jgi:hypothetical protein
MSDCAPVGVIVNPASGSDVRRLAARATRVTQESKRDQVSRAVVGAIASGAERIIVFKDPLRIGVSAVENIRLGAEIEILEVENRYEASDTHRAVEAMRAAGCGALIVLGGDGTSRAVCQAWQDAPLVPLSTGTNNVFPLMVEATIAGAAAGLVASGGVELAAVSQPAKVVHVEAPGGKRELALVDMVRLEGDNSGNLMPVDPTMIRDVVLARAEAAAVGMSPIGGLFEPCGAEDDFGVIVRCVPHEAGGQSLRVPISPGLFRTVHVEKVERLALGESRELAGPGVLAFDGDREITLAEGEPVSVQVRRDGPVVIDPARTLRAAAEAGLLVGRGTWNDARFSGAGFDCC